MRIVFVLLLAGLSGCSGLGIAAGVELASVTVFGRGVGDLGVSAVTGRDCSIVRLDRGQTYCAPADAAEKREPFCTRSLGAVDCWADPGLLPVRQREVADQPAPTPEQVRYRSARWPKSLTAF